MFGFIRRAQAEAATKTIIAQMVHMMRHQCGELPAHVWRDPYVVTWMQIVVAGLLKHLSDGKLSGGDLGMPVARIWQYATSSDSLVFIRSGASVISHAAGSIEDQAIDDAMLWLAFFKRRPNLEYPRAAKIFEAAQRQDREMLSLFGEAGDTMGSACSILFLTDVLARISELADADENLDRIAG